MAELRRITLTADRREGDRFRLTDEARHYLRRVLRLGVGDRCIVADGGGQMWEVELVKTAAGQDGDRGDLGARIITELRDRDAVATGSESPESPEFPESPGLSQFSELSVPLVLVAAVPKGNGFDEVVRQVTELGVASIVPVTSDRTVLDPSPKRVDRWRRIATEAFEQCERAIVPQVLAPQRFDHWLKTQPIHSEDRPFPWTLDAPHLIKAIAVARSEAPSLRQWMVTAGESGESEECVTAEVTRPSGLIIAIGPEGGWTPRERTLAIEAGFCEISLGCRVLRAVTASVAAVAIGAEAIEQCWV
jgi:16S rRNA (uracil1498-N3)-methyltransferase